MSDEIKKNKRRPGRDSVNEQMADQAENSFSADPTSTAEETTHMQTETSFEAEDHAESQKMSEPVQDKVRVEFYGSELLRMKAPKAFDILDNVATDWKNDGDFKALPVGHPLLQVVASEGLTRAKKIEKKLEEKGVLPMLRIGIDYAKSKLNKK